MAFAGWPDWNRIDPRWPDYSKIRTGSGIKVGPIIAIGVAIFIGLIVFSSFLFESDSAGPKASSEPATKKSKSAVSSSGPAALTKPVSRELTVASVHGPFKTRGYVHWIIEGKNENDARYVGVKLVMESLDKDAKVLKTNPSMFSGGIDPNQTFHIRISTTTSEFNRKDIVKRRFRLIDATPESATTLRYVPMQSNLEFKASGQWYSAKGTITNNSVKKLRGCRVHILGRDHNGDPIAIWTAYPPGSGVDANATKDVKSTIVYCYGDPVKWEYRAEGYHLGR